jgi:hypothetical protein
LVAAQIWCIWDYSDFLNSSLVLLLSLVFLDMVPRGRKPRSPSLSSSYAAKAGVVVAEFYEDFVPEEDKATMPNLEVEVRLIMELKDDEEVEFRVRS